MTARKTYAEPRQPSVASPSWTPRPAPRTPHEHEFVERGSGIRQCQCLATEYEWANHAKEGTE